jgi:hypothetical protein
MGRHNLISWKSAFISNKQSENERKINESEICIVSWWRNTKKKTRDLSKKSLVTIREVKNRATNITIRRCEKLDKIIKTQKRKIVFKR